MNFQLTRIKQKWILFYRSLRCELSFKGNNNVNQYILLVVIWHSMTFFKWDKELFWELSHFELAAGNSRGGAGFSLGLVFPFSTSTPGSYAAETCSRMCAPTPEEFHCGLPNFSFTQGSALEYRKHFCLDKLRNGETKWFLSAGANLYVGTLDVSQKGKFRHL